MQLRESHSIPLGLRIKAAVRMVHRHKNNETVSQISQDTHISRSKLYLLEERYLEDSRMKDKQRSGRPQKFDTYMEIRIVRNFKKDPFQTATKMIKEINEAMKEEYQIAPRTVRAVAQRNGLLAFRPSLKPPLDKDAIKSRLAFAKAYSISLPNSSSICLIILNFLILEIHLSS